MRVYAVDARYLISEDTPVCVVQAVAYHGETSRCGQRSPFHPQANVTNSLREPLHVVRSKHIFPDVTKPTTQLVVSERVKKELQLLPAIEFLPVVFEKLVDFYFAKGDRSYLDDFGTETYIEPYNYIRQLPDDPDAHQGVGTFYEVLSAENEALVSRYENVRHFEIAIGPNKTMPVECDLSAQMVRDYPIIEARYGVILGERAFRILEPYFDWDYFAKAAFEV